MNSRPCTDPECDGELRLRVAKKGKYAGQSFWGCSNWKKTGCKVIINENDEFPSQDNTKNDFSTLEYLNTKKREKTFN